MSEQSETTDTLSDIPQGWTESVYAKVNGILGEWCRQSGCVWIKTPEDWVRALPDAYVHDIKIIDVYNPDTHKAVQRGQAVPNEAGSPNGRTDIPEGVKNSIIGRLNGAIGEFCRSDGSIWMKQPENTWERRMPDDDLYVVQFEPLEVLNPDTHAAVTHEEAEYL